jgi:hypothetical protein
VYGPGTIENLDGSFMQSGHHLRNLIVELNTLAALRGKKP